MKNLKITLFGAIILFSNAAMSQTFGVGAGANYSSIHFSDDDGSDDFYDGYKNLIGINVGGFYDLNLNDNIGIRLGLKYSSKGYKYKSEYTNSSSFGGVTYTETSETNINTRLNYLQINPEFKYQMEIGRDNAFYAKVGPYIGFAISGKQKGEYSYSYSDGTTTVSESDILNEKIEFGPDGDGIDVLDFGITPAVGFEFNNIYVEVSYDFGLNNIDTENDPDFKVHNRNVSATIGYVFGK